DGPARGAGGGKTGVGDRVADPWRFLAIVPDGRLRPAAPKATSKPRGRGWCGYEEVSLCDYCTRNKEVGSEPQRLNTTSQRSLRGFQSLPNATGLSVWIFDAARKNQSSFSGAVTQNLSAVDFITSMRNQALGTSSGPLVAL